MDRETSKNGLSLLAVVFTSTYSVTSLPLDASRFCAPEPVVRGTAIVAHRRAVPVKECSGGGWAGWGSGHCDSLA